jgi:hypothetical protein
MCSQKKKKIRTSEAASFKASKLVTALKQIGRDATSDENEHMMDMQLDADECKTYVEYTVLLTYAVSH